MVDVLKEEIISYYEGNGKWKKGSWEKDSYRLFGAAEAVDVYRILLSHKLIPPFNEDFIFLSPTANCSIHELAIWQEDSKKRTGRNLFLAGDIRQIQLSPQALTEINRLQNPQHRFNYFRWDAEQLPIAANSVDLIWDRKGWIWQSTVDTINILSRGIWDILAEDFNILDMGKEYYRIRCLVKK